MLVGLIQPGGTRYLAYLSVEKVGVAVTAPLRATTPLFSSLMAIMVLNEQLTAAVAAGTTLVVCGIILLSTREEKDRRVDEHLRHPAAVERLRWPDPPRSSERSAWRRSACRFLGAAVTTGTSFLAVALSLTVSWKWSTVDFNRQSLGYFLAAGCAVTLGVASVYMSLYLSDVVIVAPLASLSPLYSLVLSAVFLREVEVITTRRVVAAGLIVLGAVLITAIR